MISGLALGLALSYQIGYSASFADVWDRWKKVDSLWSVAEARPRRAHAIPHLKVATTLIYGSRWSEACAQLDQAIADLNGQKLGPEKAATLRFKPPVAEPGKPARLVVTWAYRPSRLDPMSLRIGNRTVTITPGRALTLDVLPERIEPELARNPELGVPIPAQVGGASHVVFLSVLKSPRSRIAALLKSPNKTARDLGEKALAILESGLASDPSVSLVSTIGLGENLSKGQEEVTQLDEIPHARSGSTSIRVVLPKSVDQAKPLIIVIGLSEFGGESAFFEGFGQGSAPAEAMRRGWAFIGCSASESPVQDARKWISEFAGRRIAKVFVMAYGRSSTSSLQSGPAAAALLAPSLLQGPAPAETRLGLFFGEHDALSNVREFERRNARTFEIPEAEHLLLPGSAMGRVFEFFDAQD